MSTVKVTAPSDLEAGYTFEAMADGKSFTVTVPEGGVKKGQEFEVPFPAEGDLVTKNDGPREWKNELCSCFETCACPFFMGWCFPGVLAGQVFQRMKYNIIGQETSDPSNTCMIMTGIFFAAWVLAIILAAATGAGAVIWYIFYIYVIVAMTLGRNNMRKKYNIKGSCCESALDDCCCAYWCGCCTLIQMHRETHDEVQYKYDISSKTGLGPDAPEIV